MIFQGYWDFVGFYILNGVFFELLVIDHNKWRFMVIKCDIYIYIYISYGMYDQHICKSYTYDGLCLKMCIFVSIFCCPSTNLHIYIYIHIHISVYIYIYLYIYIYVMS